MKLYKKLYAAIIFTTFFNGKSISKNERSVFLSKHAQLIELGKQVTAQEERVRGLMQKIIECIPAIKEKKREQLMQVYKDADLTDAQVNTAFVEELTQFGHVCSAQDNQDKTYIAHDAFFPNVKKPLDAENLIFKFYVASHGIELLALCTLLDEWEELKREMIILYSCKNNNG